MNKCIQIGNLNMSYEQSGRVYSIDGISPTIMGNSHGKTSGGYNAVKILVKDKRDDVINKMIVIGNTVPSKHTAGRIFDTEGISPTVMYRNSKVVQIKDINDKINNRSDSMYKNNLEKLNFAMEEIRLFDSFAGIGALHQSLKELGVPVKVVGLSEVDIDAIISYAGIHIDNFKDLEFTYPSDDEMKQYLMDRNIGYDFDKQKSSVPRMKKGKLKLCYKACILTNNLGDIGNLDYKNIPDFDLFNFSFCCQDISVAGKQKGLKNEDGTPTRSGLVKYGIEVIKTKKPKYIMIENVKNLIGKKFIGDFYGIVDEIEQLGYKCYYPTKEDKKGNKIPTCLNAKDYGIPQNRERIFVICIRKDVDNGTFEFPIGKDYGVRLKHLLEDSVEEKYYLSNEYMDRFMSSLSNKDLQNKIPHDGMMEALGTTQPIEAQGTNSRHWVHNVDKIVGALSATDYKQPKQILEVNEDKESINEIIKLFDIPKEILNDNERQRRVYSSDGITPTILARTDNAKIINKNELNQVGNIGDSNSQGNRVYSDEGLACTQVGNAGGLGAKTGLYLNDFRIRKLTPKECWRLMGFRDEHIDRVKELGISDSQLYKQAGNSIVVNVLYYIFKNLFKDYIVK